MLTVNSSLIFIIGRKLTHNCFGAVEYKKGEVPQLKSTGKYEKASNPSLIALSPSADVVVVAAANYLAFYSALNGDLHHTINDIYTGKLICKLPLKQHLLFIFKRCKFPVTVNRNMLIVKI